MSETGIRQEAKELAKRIADLPDLERQGVLNCLCFYLDAFTGNTETKASHRLTAESQKT